VIIDFAKAELLAIAGLANAETAVRPDLGAVPERRRDHLNRVVELAFVVRPKHGISLASVSRRGDTRCEEKFAQESSKQT
jgi:hypothetical protein